MSDTEFADEARTETGGYDRAQATTPGAAATARQSGGPLAGTRVLEVAGIGPGPYACMLLADLGAEVIRVERPGRAAHPGRDPTLRGRRSITLDLKKPAAVDVLLRLVDRCDVLVEGFRPGVAERLGFGPEVCCARNPRLVYGRITGWGQTGPLARTAGHDINYLALSGFLHQIGPGGGKPVPPINVVADYGGGGMLLAYGLACALLERHRSGRGQVVDATMLDGVASFLASTFALREQGHWRDAPGANFLTGAAHFYDTYETRDGKWVAIGAIERSFHDQMLAKLGLDPEEFRAGQGFEGADYSRLVEEIWPPLKAKLAAAIRRHTRAELEQLFDGTDACVTPVLSLGEAARHPHNVARQTYVEVGDMVQNAPAPRFSRSVPRAPQPSHAAGCEGEAILAELGYAAGEIDALRRTGALPG